MENNQKLTIERIHQIYEAIESVKENDKIDFKVAYRLGRLSDAAKSIVKNYENQREKLRQVLVEKQIKLKKEMDKAQESRKMELELEIRELNEQFVKQLNELVEIEEEISLPKLKLSDFEDKGINIKFFSGMGEIIQEELEDKKE